MPRRRAHPPLPLLHRNQQVSKSFTVTPLVTGDIKDFRAYYEYKADTHSRVGGVLGVVGKERGIEFTLPRRHQVS